MTVVPTKLSRNRLLSWLVLPLDNVNGGSLYMFKRSLIALGLLAILAIAGFADQAVWISKADAQKTAAFLKDTAEIVNYCKPCDDKSKTLEKIETVTAAATGTDAYWEVKVNGKGIDLAYVYFKNKDGKWANLAMEMGIKVEDVPKFIEY